MHSIFDGNGGTCKTLCASEYKVIEFIVRIKNEKTNSIKLIFVLLNAQSLEKIAKLK